MWSRSLNVGRRWRCRAGTSVPADTHLSAHPRDAGTEVPAPHLRSPGCTFLHMFPISAICQPMRRLQHVTAPSALEISDTSSSRTSIPSARRRDAVAGQEAP
jgi:hypothetical protein